MRIVLWGLVKEGLIVRLKDRSLVACFAAACFVVASAALAQTPGYTDVPDRFRIEAGGFRIGSKTELSFDETGGGAQPVNFESLDLPDTATRFYLEGFFRPWRRHLFSLSWYANNRDGDTRTLDRDITWGDHVIHAGASAATHVGSSYVSGVYRFAAYKNDRIEIGPSLGIGYLSVTAGIRGEGSASTPIGSVSAPFDISKSLGQITGDLGGYLYWWPARRFLVRGDLRYIVVKPGDSEAAVTDGRAAVLFHPLRNLGVGVQYVYTKFRYDRTLLSSELGGRIRYSGGQLVLSGTF